MSTRVLAALVYAVLAAGCAQDPVFAFRSQQVVASAPLKRLRVYAPIVTGELASPVTPAMYDAFQASLVFRLSLCRVVAEISPFALLAASGTESPGVAERHTLTIRVADKQVIETRLMDQFHHQYGTLYHGTLYFGIELADPRSHAAIWSARSSFRFPTPDRDDEIAGTSVARGIVTQLQHDGWLTACAREAYPGCLADRREERRRAEQITDDRERIKTLNELPECR